METEERESGVFDEDRILCELKHFLPSQSPLKDFIHHNTLHAFQEMKFEHAVRHASKVFGFKTTLSVAEFRSLHQGGAIATAILENVVKRRKGDDWQKWFENALHKNYDENIYKRIGRLRSLWRTHYHIDLNTIVHTNIFRILNSYLDQGIAVKKFPYLGGGFLDAVRNLERNSFISFFKTKRAKTLLLDNKASLSDLLMDLVGDSRYFEQYLFDQQYAHPGWSGLVSVIEDAPHTLMDRREISLRDMVYLELLLEIDNLYNQRPNWKPLISVIDEEPVHILHYEEPTEYDEIISIWQEAYEWTYYDQVLRGISQQQLRPNGKIPTFQAFFCIDDRECSIRRHVESLDPSCATFGTPGHFGIDMYYQPKNAVFYTKVCPAPVSPKHLVKEISTNRENDSDVHFTKNSHSLFRGWLITQTLGFWSAIKLMFNIFKPRLSPASSHSFSHMGENSNLTVENRSKAHTEHGLQIGYTVHEMADRVESVLKSTGLVDHFAPIVYVIGHGASSANNTHYAGYDCGACSGRPGSANARAFSFMANHKSVRSLLKDRGIEIPETTEFIGALHDTTQDVIAFYDEELLSPSNRTLHVGNQGIFRKALQRNAKERSRRLMSIDTKASEVQIHEKIKRRAYSLFEPRPELNHATNALCIIGRKHVNDHLFLDRRAFLNSYNYQVDPDGKHLKSIVNAAAPVCGGINLEYLFSRTDNEKLGAGSKLPHNVMGLIGVANGFEGDLRPGLPMQMIEVHDPIRLMMVIEQKPEVVLEVFQSNPATYNWVINEWVILAVIHPETREVFRFLDGAFVKYTPQTSKLSTLMPDELMHEIEEHMDNLPVYQLS